MASVLIVEDNVVVAVMLEAMIRKIGYDVIGPCISEADAMTAIADDAPIYAVLDINLGGDETSFALADVLLQQGVKIAFSSAYAKGIVPEHLTSASFLPKPVSEADLRSFLTDV